MIICEEYAAMDLNMSHIVIWPISLVSGSTVIYITSQIVNSDYIINVMLNLRNPHNGQLYLSSKVYSTQCPRCKVNNFSDCEHDVFMPRYFDKERVEIVTNLMKGYQEIFKREIRNEQIQNELKKCFDPQQVALLNHPDQEYDQDNLQPEVYIVIDPNAGGETSRYAIVSFITEDVKMVNSSETRKCLIVSKSRIIYFFIYFLFILII
jgi:hypothetical protein